MLGRMLFYLLWPLIWIYAPLTRRVRLVVVHHGKILVVKKWFGPGFWQLPGGGIKMGETVISAAARELEEELNLKLTGLRELHQNTVIHRQFGLLMRYHFVVAELVDDNPDFVLSKELTGVEWQELNKLENISLEVMKGLSLVSKQR